MFKIQYIIGASALAVSSLALATSDIIRQDQENECAIYLCLPTGFSASECKAPHKRFIERTKLNVPDLPTQKRIADILSAYDDLIENNNRRIALLEKAAQELYKEWFVRFRFPGYENAKFENGLPEGWKRKKISAYYDTCSGGTPSRTLRNTLRRVFIRGSKPEKSRIVLLLTRRNT